MPLIFVVLSPFTGINIVYLGECIRGGKQDEKHVNLQRLKEERDITLRLTIFLNHAWNSRLATSRPLGEWSEPFLAAKRPTASDEVARGRIVSLAGFSIALCAPYEIGRRTFLKL